MVKHTAKKRAALLLGAVLMFQLPAAGLAPSYETYAYTEKRATVKATSLNVRSGPGTSYSIVGKLSNGTGVTVVGEDTASDGVRWYQIRFTGSGGAETTGYVSNSYLRFPTAYSADADFENFLNEEGFPDSYKDSLRALHAAHPQWVFRAQKTGLDWNTVIENEAVVGRNLVASSSISSWKSTADNAYDWSTGVWPGFDGSSWVAASEDIIRYYMDPRNFLDEDYVFQFLLQRYDGSVHTADGLRTMLKGTFMESNQTAGEGSSSDGSSSGGTVSGGPGGESTSGSSESSGSSGEEGPWAGGQPGGNSSSGSQENIDSSAPTGSGDQGISFEGPMASISSYSLKRLTSSYGPGMNIDGDSPGSGDNTSTVNISPSGNIDYAQVILNAGSQSGVNPYVLAAMIIQEVGKQGSDSVSGTRSGYEGYYNFYNIGAYATDSMGAVERGLWYASQSGSYSRPWNSPEKAILGGAEYYGTNFVNAGQDTFYLKKFNVQGANLYKHQYMTNIQAAASEGYHMASAYNDDLKNTALEFKIPVYNNMPASPCAKPTITGSPNNKLSGLGVDGFALTPTFNMDTYSYDLIVDQSVSSVNVQAGAIDSKATVSGTGTVDLQSGINEIKVTVKAENGSVREYVLHVIRQANGPTYTQGTGGAGTGTSPGSPGGSSSDNSDTSSGGPGVVIGPGESSGGEVLSPLGAALQPEKEFEYHV